MSFVFEKIDAIERERSQKDETLQRIRAWRESKKQPSTITTESGPAESADSEQHLLHGNESKGVSDSLLSSKREVELSHPWPEWVELMERLVQQNYFDHRRKDEDKMLENSGFSLSEMVEEDGFDFTRDLKTVLNAVLNFGSDRFDILRSLSRQDLQVLVGHGCPSTDKRVVFSSKLLRKHVNLDEGDVCSSCSLRNSCEKAYLLTNKEEEARTIDVMRVLMTYAFGAINGSVANESLLKMKSLKVSIRKLLHEVVKLSAVPIDPNLPPPVIKRPPPKVKQPPPPPKKRVGRDDIEMKKGDWLCQKCDFMNFAKNTMCLQCDAKRPKRQLLPGEWECPQCNFLNYRRNVVCFHCEHKRPQDEFMESQMRERQRGPRTMEKVPSRREVSDAWNFDFDDNESDGADVASFEYADSKKLNQDFTPDRGWEQDRYYNSGRPAGLHEKDGPEADSSRRGTGFNDFDDEDDDIENYEVDNQNEEQKVPRVDLSELEVDSLSDDDEQTHHKWHDRNRSDSLSQKHQPKAGIDSSGSDADFDFGSDDDLPVHPDRKSSHVTQFNQKNRRRGMSFGTDDELSSGIDDNDFGTRKKMNHRRSSSWKSLSETDDSEDNDFGSRQGKVNRRDPRNSSRRDPQKSNRTMKFDSDDSDLESDNEGRFRRGKGGQRGGGRKSYSVDKRFSSKRDTFGRSSTGSQGRSFEDNYEGNRRNGRGGDSRNARNSRGGRSSFDKNRSHRFSGDNNNQSGSYLDDERYRRPRVNVR